MQPIPLKKMPKGVKIGTIVLMLLGFPPAALALDLSFFEGLTGPIAQITQIDQDFLNSGLGNLQDTQQLFKTGGVQGLGKLFNGEHLGRLGVPDSTIGAIHQNPEDIGPINTVFVDGYHRSTQVQDHIHRVLSRQGQEAQGRELGQSDGYKTVATEILQTSEQLAQQSNIEAQQAEAEAHAVSRASQTAQRCRSSQCVLKAYSRQLSHVSHQNTNITQQFAALTTNISAQSAQISALAGQQVVASRQLARQTSIQGYQLQSLDRINGALTDLNYSHLNQAERKALANQSSTNLMFIPNLQESLE